MKTSYITATIHINQQKVVGKILTWVKNRLDINEYRSKIFAFLANGITVVSLCNQH